MAINLRKLARDLKQEDLDIKMLALTTVLQLSKAGVENSADLLAVYDVLQGLTTAPDSDVVFLARKGITHLHKVMEQLNLPVPAAAPEPQPAGPIGRDELVAAIRTETDPVALATHVARLGQFKDDEVLQLALALTRHKEPRVRSNSIEVLEKQGDERRLMMALIPLLADENHRVRANAARGLGIVGYSKITGFLAEMYASTKIGNREAAVWALGHLKRDEHVQLLVRALKDPFEPIRVRAIRGLATLGATAALPVLQHLTQDMDIAICEEAVKAIAVIQGKAPPPEPVFNLDEMARQAVADEAAAASGAETSKRPIDIREESRKLAQEEVARIEKILAGGSPQLPRMDTSGRTLQELLAMSDQNLVGVGQLIAQACRAGQVNHPEVNRHYYDLLKYQELLMKRREAAKQTPDDLTGSFFNLVRTKLVGGQVEDPITKLEQRVNATLRTLAQVGVELLVRGAITMQGKEEILRRHKTLLQAIDSARATGTPPGPTKG
ncbi:MAG: HEAT repeat domain-containing protein [Candidatus Riflebacteria bacterium]|nr:HEAT repeat domain-containing protein [Candidatus Riflebacteria bacterium]